MLDSASDYQYVDVSRLGGYIDGDVLPVRSQNGAGTSVCKYEDYLFLLEAYNERVHADQAGTNSVSAASRTVTASSINSTRFQSVNVAWGNYINRNSGIPSGIVEAPDINSALSGTSLTLHSPYTRSPSFRFLDSLRERFDDAHALSKARCPFDPITTLFSSGSYAYTVYYDNGRPPRDDGSGSTVSEFFYSYASQQNGSYSTERFLAVTYGENDPVMSNYVNAASAKMLVQIEYYDFASTYRRFVAPVDCVVSNGSLSVPSGWWVDVGKAIAQIVGKQYYESAPNVFDPNQNMSLRLMTSSAFIIDFDFPADYTAV